jgi:hypothetical protein
MNGRFITTQFPSKHSFAVMAQIPSMSLVEQTQAGFIFSIRKAIIFPQSGL